MRNPWFLENILKSIIFINFIFFTIFSYPPIFLISFLSLVKNCNHKGLGIYYLLSAFIFGISGTLISVLIRIELYSSGNRIISPENQNFYNISITLHGFLMIFFLVMLFKFMKGKSRSDEKTASSKPINYNLSFSSTHFFVQTSFTLKISRWR